MKGSDPRSGTPFPSGLCALCDSVVKDPAQPLLDVQAVLSDVVPNRLG